MFKQAFRLTFVAFIWKQYKAIICSTLILFIYLWLIGTAHQDFLQYAQSQSDQALIGRSFFYKWLALTVGLICYLGFHTIRRRRQSKRLESKNASLPKKTNAPIDDNDPFAEIRNKKRLRSKADMIVKKDRGDGAN